MPKLWPPELKVLLLLAGGLGAQLRQDLGPVAGDRIGEGVFLAFVGQAGVVGVDAGLKLPGPALGQGPGLERLAETVGWPSRRILAL